MHRDIIDVFITINSFVKEYNESVEIQDMIAFRDNVIHKTNSIRDMIYSEHGEKASFYVVFVIYSYCDEVLNKVTVNTSNNISGLYLLQEEIYQRSDGGEYFFEIADIILENPIYPKIIAQVLYIILSLGFKGRYLGEDKEIDIYKNKLNSILPKYDINEFVSPGLDDINIGPRKTNKAKSSRILLISCICFSVLSYFSIWFVG